MGNETGNEVPAWMAGLAERIANGERLMMFGGRQVGKSWVHRGVNRLMTLRETNSPHPVAPPPPDSPEPVVHP